MLDGAVALFDSVAGVQPQSETVWRQADKYHVPRIAFINKMDRIGADFFNAVETMIERLGAKPVPVQIPIGAEDQFIGLVDLVTMKAIRYVDPLGQSWEEGEIPAELKEQAEEYRHDMIETVADHDDEIMEAFLERRGDRAGRAEGRDPRRHARHHDHPGAAAAPPSRTRACSRCSTPSSTTCPRRSTCRP